jgi:16S rRNA (guanine966-N2)-methyltransferase
VPGRIRITGGAARGRPVASPGGRDVRPTAARVREAVFSILGPRVAGARVLDLYAGAGTLGLEALSRGADFCLFVERAPRHAALIRANLEGLGLADRARVACADAPRLLARRPPPEGPFDIAFVDPPYGRGALGAVLPVLFGADIIAPAGLAVVEHETGAIPPAGLAWHSGRTYTYGKTAITLVTPIAAP